MRLGNIAGIHCSLAVETTAPLSRLPFSNFEKFEIAFGKQSISEYEAWEYSGDFFTVSSGGNRPAMRLGNIAGISLR